jgi:hypothetical protein
MMSVNPTMIEGSCDMTKIPPIKGGKVGFTGGIEDLGAPGEVTGSGDAEKIGGKTDISSTHPVADIRTTEQAQFDAIVQNVVAQIRSHEMTREAAIEKIVNTYIDKKFEGEIITESARENLKSSMTEFLLVDPYFRSKLESLM